MSSSVVTRTSVTGSRSNPTGYTLVLHGTVDFANAVFDLTTVSADTFKIDGTVPLMLIDQAATVTNTTAMIVVPPSNVSSSTPYEDGGAVVVRLRRRLT